MNTRLLLGLALSLTIAAAARAAPSAAPAPMSDDDYASVAVRTSDLDLSRPDGAKALLNRLRHAASAACGGRPTGTGDLGAMQVYTACYRTRLDGAVGQVRAPLVAELYHGGDQAMAATGGPG